MNAVQDVLAEAIPDRDMLVWKDVRRTFGEVADRSKGLAGFLLGRSIGLRHERGVAQLGGNRLGNRAHALHALVDLLDGRWLVDGARSAPQSNHGFTTSERGT